MKRNETLVYFLIIFSVMSCKPGREMKMDSGFKYVIYTESTGPHAEIGNYVTMEMVYRNNKDSILFDSRQNGSPIRFRLEKIPFRGSYEEGLTYLSAGDSATFFVPADSLYYYLYKSRGVDVISQEETGLHAGTEVKFDIRVLKIQNEVEAEEEMLMEFSKMEKQEKQDFSKYISDKNISSSMDTSGYYMLVTEKGSGPAIDSGKVITVEYEGRFLNDSIFDGTQKAGKPYKFISGAHHVIPGWEIAMKKLQEGDRITLLVPSRLAFGEDGIRDPQNGTYIVPPYTPLVFDIKIISVEDAPAVSGK